MKEKILFICVHGGRLVTGALLCYPGLPHDPSLVSISRLVVRPALLRIPVHGMG